MSKTVYVAFSADIIHQGHLNILNKAAELGDVTVGVLTDEVVAAYKRYPILDYETRAGLFSNMKQVTRVVKQETLSYRDNLLALKPDYVVHGDDWKSGFQEKIREEVIETVKEYGGELIEVPFTKNVSGSKLDMQIRQLINTPDIRRAKLRKLLKIKPYLRVMEASNGLSGLIVENARYEDVNASCVREYDAMWISSLCDSTFKGKPDIELVDFTSRINTINGIMEVTTKPIILDGDTGGKTEHLVYNVKTLERIGVSAVVLEDKTGLKQNSLYGTDAKQVLEDPYIFAAKLKAGKQAQVTEDFMIFARCESLIAGRGMKDALDRARIYLQEGNADGIMIPSRNKDGKEIHDFLEEFRKEFPETPVILVPTSYNHVKEEELCEWGANIIIYANHLLRSAYKGMKETADIILRSGRSKETDDTIISIKEVLSLVPGGKQ